MKVYSKQKCYTITNSGIFAALLVTITMRAFGESLCMGAKDYSLGVRTTHSRPNAVDEGKWYTGVQARTHLTPGLVVEGSIDYRRNNYLRDIEIIVYPVQVSLLTYLMPQARMSPFLLCGVGWYYTRVKNLSGFNDTRDRFGIHAGAGFEYIFNKIISLDGSYRYVWLERVPVKDSNNIENTYQDKGSMITVALNVLF